MNLYDKSSLILVPGAVKDGKVYSQRPENGDGDFTFTRGSNLAATRVDENGLIEKGRENLLLQSNQFDTTWAIYNSVSVLGGQSGYDGGSDAWLLQANAANGHLRQTITSVSGIVTYSIYAKPNSLNTILIQIKQTSDAYAYFDLSDGSLLSNTNLIDSSIVALSNGWYRVSITANVSASTQIRLYPSQDSDTSITSGSIYIQDAQLELGLVATDYIETTTTTAQAGILEDMPRLDYTDASCPSLLLEPQRTNKITNSEFINTTTFNLSSLVNITNNYAISPDGTSNAAKIIPTAVSGYHQLRTQLATANGYDMVSCFVKASGYNYAQLSSWATGTDYINFDLTNGVIGSIGATGPTIYGIEDYGNGWYRIHANVKANGGGVIGIGIVTSASAAWAESFVGNGADGILVWGVQLEAASYATSYIPTYRTSVTRNGDVCTKTGVSSLIGQTEGTIFLEFLKDNSGIGVISINDGSSQNRVYLGYSGANFIGQVRSGGGTAQAAFSSPLNVGEVYKCAIAYKLNDFVLYINGVQISTDTSGIVPVGMDSFSFNASTSSDAPMASPVSQSLLFKTRLSNEELADLTTL